MCLKRLYSLERHKKTVDLLNTATVKLNTCLEEKATSEALAEAYLNQISDLKKEMISYSTRVKIILNLLLKVLKI